MFPIKTIGNFFSFAVINPAVSVTLYIFMS